MNLTNVTMPPVFKRNGKDCYLDPVREMLVYVTPEETVRQKVISYLIESLGVPIEMIAVEEHLSHYGINSKRRADIVIHQITNVDESAEALAVIECKAPNVFLSERTAVQMFDYAQSLGCKYAAMINGIDSCCYIFSEEKDIYVPIESLPAYCEMSNGIYEELEIEEPPVRIPFNETESYLKEYLKYEDDFNPWEFFISPQTPFDIAHAAFNLSECLFDARVKIPARKFGIFNLIEDFGVRILTYGNSSGGTFAGPYRSFLIDYNGSTEFVSLSVTTFWKSDKHDNVKTCLCVAIDNEKTAHHALQLCFDDNITIDGDNVKFYHHGRIAVGNKGSGKINELRVFVEKICPDLISGKRFYLGSLKNNKNWTFEDGDVIKLIENLISYALARDEYRKYKKSN